MWLTSGLLWELRHAEAICEQGLKNVHQASQFKEHGWGRNRTADRWILSPCSSLGYQPQKLFASAAAIQPSAAALEAGLMEQEQHYPCCAVLP